MAWRLEIAGVDQTASIRVSEPVVIEKNLNGRQRVTFVCLPPLLPERFASVMIYAQDGVTELFGGFILSRDTRGLVASAEPSLVTCEAVGSEAYLDWATLTLTWTTDPTLQEVLDDIIAALPASYGITLDATDYSGVTLSAFAWTNVRASDALREVCDRTGMVFILSPSKVLSLVQPGATEAPYVVIDGSPNAHDLTWTDPTEPPVTSIVLLCGTGQAVHPQTWVSDGGDGPWVGDVPAAGPGGYWVVTLTPPGNLYCTVDDGSGGGMFSWDWETRTLTSNIGNIAAGTVLSFPYTAQYPFTVTASVGSPLTTPEVARVIERQDIFSVAQGQEVADGLLAQQSAVAARQVTITSREHGWEPGQEVVVNLAGRGLDATCAITNVTITLDSDLVWNYVVAAVELTLYDGGYLAAWRALLNGSSSGAGSAVTAVEGGGSVTVLSTPSPYFLGGSRVHAVQVPA